MSVSVCPYCNADLRGEPIPDKYFEHDLESDAHKQSAESCKKWNSPGNSAHGCFCLHYGDRAPGDRFYKRTIGVEIQGVYDGVLYWACPDCGGAWHRWPEGDPLYRSAEQYIKKTNSSLLEL